MTASSAFVDAAFGVSRRHSTSDWIEPFDTSRRRAELADLVDTGVASVARFDYELHGVPDYLSDIRRLRELLRSLDDTVRPLATTYVDALEVRARAISSDDDAGYSAVVADLDGLPDPLLVAEARTILESGPPDPENGSITAEEAADALRSAIAQLDLDDWSIEINDQMSASMSVNGPRRRIRVRADARFTPSAVRRLVIHEVGGHALRWSRSAAQAEPLARLPLGRTTPTEEGLALWGEARHGLLDRAALRTYAARVVAVDVARASGILEVARSVAPYVGVATAAQTAMRVKRGLRDPNMPGGSTKDWSYLGGLRMCERLAGHEPSDIALLLGVKWGADCLPTARALAAEGRIRRWPPDTFAF